MKKWDDGDLWFHKDEKFKQLKAFFRFRIYTNDLPFVSGDGGDRSSRGIDPEARHLFTTMWVEMVNHHLKIYNLLPNEMGYEFEVSLDQDHIQFYFSGFSDKLSNYIQQTLLKVTQMKHVNLEMEFN